MRSLRVYLLGILVFKSVGYSTSTNGLATVEEAYLNCVKQMGSSYKHSLFQKAMNKFHPCKTIKVNKNPRLGAFTSVQKANNSQPVVNNFRIILSLGPGIYREKVEIPNTMAYITVEGSGIDNTIIEWDDMADRLGQSGRPLGTFGSATFANKVPLPPSAARGKQAVAMRKSANAVAFISCKFIGSLDTLRDHIGRHYFENCYIEGSVDFIFGNGLSIYRGCHLHATGNSYGALTAQKGDNLLQVTWFSFVKV